MAEELHESYSGKVIYSLSFGRNNYIQPMKWMKFLPWIGTKMSEIQLYYTINDFVYSMEKCYLNKDIHFELVLGIYILFKQYFCDQ